MVTKIIESFANFLRKGSGWRLKRVVKLIITKSRQNPNRGSSNIPLPKKIANRKALINMMSNDDKCFKWAVTRALNPVTKNAERISKELKKQASELNWNGVEFPTPCTEKQFKTFEKNNDVSINVFGHEGDEIFPLYVSEAKHEKVVRLFFQRSKDGKNSHYCVVKSMSRLTSSQGRNHHARVWVCDFCLNSFSKEDVLDRHKLSCTQHDCVHTIFPEPGKNTTNFKNYQNEVECPIKIYADFESILEPMCDTKGKTKLYQRHVPSAFCFYVVSRVPEFEMDPITYVKQGDEDVAKVFCEKLEETTRKIYERFKDDKPMIFDDAARKHYASQTVCYACGEPFSEEKGLKKVRDHCHYTGKFRGALHSKCNLRLRKGNTIPVFFHNLEGYDLHLFVKRLADTDGDVNCIPHNEEKYITFTKSVWVGAVETKSGNESNIYTRLQFVDTMHFMASSLEKLAKNLDRSMFKHSSKYFSSDKLDLMLKKGIYPYKYMNDTEKLNETQLPPIEKFYSSLSDSNITEAEYEHAKTVFEKFKCRNLGEYTELYCKSTVLLLADVFENFIDVWLEKYKLDPSHYITAPALALDAMLKMTEVQLELLTDPYMFLFFERGVRGGVSMITKKYAKANNRYMGDEYDPTKPSVYIPYLDANNLYGWAMSQPLPCSDFAWLSEEETLKKTTDHSKIQKCTLEVDLEYPPNLHDLHNDYPLAPESIVVNKVEKLIPNLNDTQNYVVHHHMLQQCLKRGLILKKIHRGLKYEESTFLKTYIDSNTASRTTAKSDFETDFFKLKNNSVFGKTMENVRLRCSVEIANGSDEKRIERLIAKPNYKNGYIFENSNLVSMRM